MGALSNSISPDRSPSRESESAPNAATDAHVLGIIASSREALVKQMTDIVYVSGSAPIDRTTAEQLIRGVVVVLEEWLGGQSTDIRRAYLETALPEVARTDASPWSIVLRQGLPCWGLLIGLLAAHADEPHRLAVIRRLSLIQGEWWADVWEAMAPVYKSRGGP
jgi:hypothetical protein